jgi:hypothetical protein
MARATSTRRCGRCGEPYARRNLIEIWDTRNEGHRDGWHKTIARVCLKCQSDAESRRVLVLAHIRVLGHDAKRA